MPRDKIPPAKGGGSRKPWRVNHPKPSNQGEPKRVREAYDKVVADKKKENEGKNPQQDKLSGISENPLISVEEEGGFLSCQVRACRS
jgi:hypothetical protein